MIIILSHCFCFYFRNPEIDPDNPSHEQYMVHFLDALVKEIELKANAMVEDPYFLRIKLQGAVTNFKVCPYRAYRFGVFNLKFIV